MLLLCDIGNTRFKWAVLSGQELGEQDAQLHASWNAAQVREHVLTPAGKVSRVIVSNVGGDKIGEVLRRAVQEHLGFAPQFIRSTAQAAGVRNAYPQPETLGVDRWVAMIGAHDLERRAVCVVDVGTATTIDAIAADGMHLGGLIVPGPDLMVSSLMKNTSDIARFARQGHMNTGLFADNTLAALNHGAVHALAALVERAVDTTRREIAEEPSLLLTGGASDRLEQVLRIPFKKTPDLVLRGLAVLAREKP
jgi:type III pantothenate kinase